MGAGAGMTRGCVQHVYVAVFEVGLVAVSESVYGDSRINRRLPQIVQHVLVAVCGVGAAGGGGWEGDGARVCMVIAGPVGVYHRPDSRQKHTHKNDFQSPPTPTPFTSSMF